METTVHIILLTIGIYLGVGFVFALFFVSKGVEKMDPAAREGASICFRIAILPATMIFWPMLAKRWVKGTDTPPEECSPHRCAACKGKSS